MALRIILADDHKIVRESFRALLENEPTINIVADVADGEAAVRATLELNPDIVVMDITMPIMSGMEATRQILQKRPQTKIIALSMHTRPSVIASMMDAGASAFIPKTCKAAELIKAIQVITKGKIYMAPSLSLPPAAKPSRQTPQGDDIPLDILSRREQQLLVLMAEGCSTRASAEKLSISMASIATFRERIMRKLKIKTIAGLTKYAIREGLTSI